jgi:hypothetical protein
MATPSLADLPLELRVAYPVSVFPNGATLLIILRKEKTGRAKAQPVGWRPEGASLPLDWQASDVIILRGEKGRAIFEKTRPEFF